MNRTSLNVAATDQGEPSAEFDLAAGELAAAATWIDRIELVSRSLPRLPGLAAALHWLGLQLAWPLAASRFQVWQIHDWRDGAGLVQPWLESDDQAGVQTIDLAQLDLLREGEGALGLALSSGRAAYAPVRGPAAGQSLDQASLDAAGTSVIVPRPGDSATATSARLCLAVGLHNANGEPFAALEWWLNETPADDALPALTMLARLVAARAPLWIHPTALSRDTHGALMPATTDDVCAAAATADEFRVAVEPSQELAIAMAAALPASLVLLDTELNVLLVNRHAQREFGLLPEQASGHGLAQLFGAAAGQDLAAGAAQSSTRGGLVEQQLVFATVQGPRQVLARSSALCDTAGQVRLLMCHLQTRGSGEPRLAGMRELARPVTSGQPGATFGERRSNVDASVRSEPGDADLQAPLAVRPICMSPNLSIVRAASVMLAPRAAAAALVAGRSPELLPDVLVIDDHAVNQELMIQMLLHLGCRARSAGSAEEGLADLCGRAADLVLMDIRMPGMDGLQALAWIRQGASQRFALRTPASLPVVAVTGHAVAGDAERCLEHGFDAYLAKPCRLEDLRLVLDGLLSWRPTEPMVDAGDTVPDRGTFGHETPAPLPSADLTGNTAAQAVGASARVASEPESTSQLGEGLPVFDHQALLRLRALDPSGQNQLLVRVMKAFDLSLQRLSTQLRSARQSRDVSVVQLAAHTLKSSSASIGAMRLSGLCLDVEAALRRAGATFGVTPAAADEALGEPVDRLIDEIDRVQAALPQWLAGGASATLATSGAAASGANS